LVQTPIAIQTRSEDDLKALVHQLDPKLEYIKDLHPTASTCRTLLVKHEGVECTLKVRKLTQNIWDDTYFYFEISALKRVAERKLDGITHLIEEYKDERFHAILKSYASGTPLDRLDVDELLHNHEFIKKLDAMYLKLHLAGIAKIKFLPRKMIVSENGDLILVDMSTCIVNTDSGIQLFSQQMREDSRFITKLERHATH
jgi:hypothetical protein